ncbi:MAG: primase C-terminal domain-containing protein, partial [Acidobacteriota bacterium]
LILEHGRLPDTPEQITGGGGRHFVFRHPGLPVPKELAAGIDLKGDGGYIVVAPSIHSSGNAYQWHGIAGAKALLNPANVPPWLLERIAAARNRARVESEKADSEKWGEGQRNNRLMSVAGTMRRRGLSQEAIEAALLAENLQRCDPPLSEGEVRRIAESAASYKPADEGQQRAVRGDSDENLAGGKKSQATMLIELACGDGVELFHAPSGEAYATVPVNDHSENWAIKSGGFRRWLRWRFYKLTGKGPNAQAIQDAVNTIAAIAEYASPEHPVFVRVAEMDGSVYLDLANDAWQGVKIDAQGWQVADPLPVRFIRRRGMLPLPLPERGSRLEVLRQFVNVGNDSDWTLLLSWLVAAFRARGPYPVLVLHGEQGTAKSSTARVLRGIIDPNTAPLRSEPKDSRDLIIAASNSWVINFDNLSHLPAWLSDALCRLSTGGGFATRELYTDAEEIIFEATRPVILNGIEELATRGDLLDRALILYLPQISNEKRKREADFWRDFEQARPQLLGAVLDAVSIGLRNLPAVSLKESPRMADFAAWATAAEPAFGVKGVSFAQAYKGNRESANDLVLDSSQVAQAVKSLVADGSFKGSATELLAALNHKVGDDIRRERSWPKNGRGLSNRLRRLAPNLRQVGVCIKFDGTDGRGKEKKRVIELEKSPDLPSPPSPSSPEPANGKEQTTFGEMPMGTQTASPTDLASPLNPLEINHGDIGDAGDTKFPSFSDSPESEEESDYGEI